MYTYNKNGNITERFGFSGSGDNDWLQWSFLGLVFLVLLVFFIKRHRQSAKNKEKFGFNFI